MDQTTSIFEKELYDEVVFDLKGEKDAAVDLLSIISEKHNQPIREELLKFFKIEPEDERYKEIDPYNDPEYESIFFDLLFSKEDFYTVFFTWYGVIKNKEYLIKYLVMEYVIKKKVNYRRFISRIIDNIRCEDVRENVFNRFYKALFMDYNFSLALKLHEECVEGLKSTFFYSDQVDTFCKNCKFFLFQEFLQLYSSESFGNFFGEMLKERENELILLHVFVSSKIKSKFREGPTAKHLYEKYSKCVSHNDSIRKRIMNDNFLLKLTSILNRVK